MQQAILHFFGDDDEPEDFLPDGTPITKDDIIYPRPKNEDEEDEDFIGYYPEPSQK